MGNAPEPEFHPDGTFHLVRSNGEVVVGTCQDPSFRLSRRLIRTNPDTWYADCNVPEAPRTLRIYRLGADQTLEEVHLHLFNAKTSEWSEIKPQKRQGSYEQKNNLWPRTKLFRSITKPIAPLVSFLRWLLGDFEVWPTWGKYEPVRTEPLGPSGHKVFGDGPFYPEIIIYASGDIVLEDTHFKHNSKINKVSKNERFRFFRKRGRFQLFYILVKNSNDEYMPNAVLNYQYGDWWVWKQVGPGSLSDARPIVGKRAAIVLYVLGIIYLSLHLFQ